MKHFLFSSPTEINNNNKKLIHFIKTESNVMRWDRRFLFTGFILTESEWNDDRVNFRRKNSIAM